MHSHDRTMLAKLGFSDPDKRDDLHDFGCRYLMLPENHKRLVQALIGPTGDVSSRQLGRGKLEHPISKGHDQYKSVIGFIDLVLAFDELYVSDKNETYRSGACLAIEVKIQPVQIGDIVRQIRLYREFFNATPVHWVAATAFPLNKGYTDALLGAGIRHVHLGDGFKTWVSTQTTPTQEPGSSLVF